MSVGGMTVLVLLGLFLTGCATQRPMVPVVQDCFVDDEVSGGNIDEVPEGTWEKAAAILDALAQNPSYLGIQEADRQLYLIFKNSAPD